MTPLEGVTEYFPGDTYTTPADHPRDFGDSVCLGGTFYFYVRHSMLMLDSRSLALADRYGDAAWSQASRVIMDLLERCGARFHISGLDHLHGATGPLVFICNHMSTTETQVLPCLISPTMRVTFIVKRSLTTMPIFGAIMRSRDPITVGRENPREDMVTVMTEGTKRLQDNTSVIVFPQATRHRVFQPAKFNSLGVKLAKRADVQVMPIAVKTDFWSPGRGRLKDFGPLHRDRPVHIEFGAPMTVEGNGKEQHEFIVEFIRSRLVEWGGEVAEAE